MDDERDAADRDLEREPASLHVPLDARIAGEIVEDGWGGDRDGDLRSRADRSEGSAADAGAWGAMLADTAGTMGAFMETALDGIPWQVGEPEPDPMSERSAADMEVTFQPEEIHFRPGDDGEASDSDHRDVIET
jgi:hypothetical protein